MPEIARLSEQAEGLKDEVRGLRLAVEQMEPRIKRAERVSIRTAMAATIVLLLAIAVGFVGYRGILTDQRIDGLCPILALVVGSADPESRAPGTDRDQYVVALNVMRQAYSDLGCTTPFVPPRRPGSSPP
jgi:predicted RND superfamily exporter protein